MNILKKYFRIYKKLTVRSIVSLMEYKVDFLVGLLGFFTTQIIGIFTLNVIFEQIPELNGWKYSEVLLVYAMAQIPKGIDHLLTDNLWLLSNRTIVRSEFDKYLLRPINPLFYFLAEKFQTDAIGEILIGVIILLYSIINLQIKITLFRVITFVLFIVCGTIIYFSVKLIFASLAFWFKTSDAILGMVYSTSDFAKYPTSIYPKVIKNIISFILPFAFTAYYPAAYLINRETMFTCLAGMIGSSIGILIIAMSIWKAGINAYEGAGN